MERRKVKVEKRTEKDISEYKKGIYIRTSISNTRPEQGNTSRSRCIQLYNRRSIVSKI